MAVKDISFIIPCYRSAATVGGVVAEITKTMETLPEKSYEVILVNDGCRDGTWEKICEIAADQPLVQGLDLSKNFGQHAALMAGLHASRGEIVVCLDDDGQTPPGEAPKLLKALDQGADVAYAKYQVRHHSFSRNFGSAMNDWMAKVLINKPKDLTISSYFAARRYVVDEMLRYGHAFPYVPGLILRATGQIVNVEVDHQVRKSGRSGYTFGKLFSLWINGFTSFSIKPLRVATFSGMIFALLGFLYGIYTILKRFLVPNVPIGFSALMSAVIFMGGMLMLMVGMAGEYIGRMYLSVNCAPQYVIRDRVQADQGKE